MLKREHLTKIETPGRFYNLYYDEYDQMIFCIIGDLFAIIEDDTLECRGLTFELQREYDENEYKLSLVFSGSVEDDALSLLFDEKYHEFKEILSSDKIEEVLEEIKNSEKLDRFIKLVFNENAKALLEELEQVKKQHEEEIVTINELMKSLKNFIN